ncbi:FadR/GntR family transcriptional regulator [Sphingomonas immobilis]|uniref:FadR/GntR family transcriptional regulator n=1 Tax=Sphingomonas immobilis TaxID=3063997 RepID=A0ABT8ZT71_9SPHN|nr:FadR/GntR family transcriptional regulator [Sphingomonas sp. CA1-15]MDO7840766.1 FadR/GntR family transcriptional regulator [Sphingomonas sp. CA1-15]
MSTDPSEIRVSLGRNLTYGLLDHLGKTIVTGGYADRPFPTEAELSKQHGVSRSVTREAVKMLTTKGLLSARPRQGTIVQPDSTWNLFDPDVLRWLLDRKFSIELLREFNQLRVAIEPAAASLAARFADEQGLALIRAGFGRMQVADNGGDDTLEADIAFHVAILRASTNPFFAQFCDVVATALRTSIRFTNRIQGRTADLAAHEAVMHAIEARDPEAARTAMMNIIDEVMELIVKSSASE